MKRLAGIILAACFLFLCAGCCAKPQIVTADDLVQTLESNGYKVLQADLPEHGSSLLHGEESLYSINKVNGFHVFEYKSHDSMESEAKGISKDGSSIGGRIVDTLYKVYVYKNGNIIVYYCGNDQKTIHALKEELGPTFAGADA